MIWKDHARTLIQMYLKTKPKTLFSKHAKAYSKKRGRLEEKKKKKKQ